MEELERMEIKEVVKVGILRFKILLVYFSLNIDELLVFIVDWSIILPISLFFLGCLPISGFPILLKRFPISS